MSARFQHLRHQPPRPLLQPRGLQIALPPMHSNVNFSRIVRAAGCFGIRRIVACGRMKPDPKIARDSLPYVQIETHRSLPPVLERMKREGLEVVVLEQATESECLFDFQFRRETVLVGGHERLGVDASVLELADRVVQIPVYGQPDSFNAATATILAMYEYCRQFPDG